MEKKKYTWTTEFQTAEGTMTHTFGKRVVVILNFKQETVTALRDGDVFNYFSIANENKVLAKDYEKFMVKIAESVEQMQAFETTPVTKEKEAAND
jgi:hypothetical protein